MVAGIGVNPCTDFLKDSGISLSEHGFINVDQHLRVQEGRTSLPTKRNCSKQKLIAFIPDVFAAGDVVMYPQK